MQTKRKFDPIERGIMLALREDPQVTNKDMARRLGVSDVMIAARLEKLIADRVLKITVQRDIRTAGYAMVALADVQVESASVADVASRIGDIAEVISVTVVVGDPQIMVLLMARDVDHLRELVEGRIGGIEGVGRVAAAISVDTLYLKPGIALL